MASTYLSKTLGTATNSKIWTFSTWLKRSGLSSTQHIFSIDNGSARDAFSFDSDNGLRFYLNDSTTGNADLSTNRILRDTSAFYHLVLTVDTTQATQEDRIKLFINGTQYSWDETVTWTNTLNANTFNASGNTFRIGRDRTAANYFNGVLTHTHFTDGYAYDASTFGETDATTGIWKAKVSPSVTYGTNGFFLKFENSGSMGLDSSGNANNFTVNGSLTQTVDTPTNVFATFNPLWRARVNNIDLPTYMSNGNLTFYSGGSDARLAYFASTLGVTSGKYYWEVKSESGSGGAVGISYDSMQSNSNAQFWDNANLLGCAIKINGNVFNGKSGDGSTALGVSYSEDDIYGFALDMDNYALYAHINGTYVNSGVPTSGASRTGSLLNLLTSGLAYLNSGEPVFPFFADLSAGSHADLKVNFGNGYFGTTAVSSATSDESGLGIFEYTVPSGYYALCTKNINEQEYD
jgi:hypothetical protein